MTEAELIAEIDKIPMRMPTALETLAKEIRALENFKNADLNREMTDADHLEIDEKLKGFKRAYNFLKELGYD